MKLPQEITENLKKEVFGVLLPGDTIVCAGPVGLRETMRVLETEKRQLAAFFSVRFLENIKSTQDAFVLSRTPEELKERFDEIDFSSLHSFIPVGEEGFLTALWKMAEVSGVGLRIDLRSVPLLQQTVEIAEILDMDPYKQDSRGACLLGTDHAEILLDTSASIDTDLLRAFVRAVRDLLREDAVVKVGCFDTEFYGFQEIHSEKDISKLEIKGAGGTNFETAVKAFSGDAETKIVFTDGYADMPETRCDAIWLVYSDMPVDPPGGKVIYVKKPEEINKYEVDFLIT